MTLKVPRSRTLHLVTASLAVAGLCAASSQVAQAPRVLKARQARGEQVRALFVDKGLPYPAPRLFIRAFKKEGLVELWAGRAQQKMQLIKSFKVCAASGELGPKRQRGDLQVPEGVYYIDRYNAYSNFHLSLGVSYPNQSDRLRGTKNPGGDIFIHGDCVTIGCLPLQDGPIEELFLASLDTHLGGQKHIPVHIFPSHLDAKGLAELERLDSTHLDFWRELAPIYQAFADSHVVPQIYIDAQGRYHLSSRSRATSRPQK
jgi:murein L,D-transpeptidase YafK